MKMAVALAVCLLLQLSAVRGEDASSSSSSSSSSSDKASMATILNSPEDLSRAKRAVDMRRLARGIQMLRLGKRSMPLWLPTNSAFPEDETLLQDLLNARDSPYYDQQEFPAFSEDPFLLHPRYRRSAENRPSYHSENEENEASVDVKRSVGFLDSREEDPDDEGYVAGKVMVHKNPMDVMRLDKRPVSMLRLGKRPMRMLRLGKREDLDEDQLGVDNDLFYPSGYDEEGVSADKRPVSMLRLGKRPVSMLRLGKRPVSMLRLGKRPVSMLRLGKRPVSMLRLGKRPVSMLRLGKRPVSMLRLGKRQLPMLRLGKRAAE